MTGSRQPVFVEQRIYRRRRLMDAARLLPLLGMLLFVLPLLWGPEGSTGQRSTATDGIYLFVAWGGMIALAALLAPGLASVPPDIGEREPSGSRGAGDAFDSEAAVQRPRSPGTGQRSSQEGEG